MRRLIPAFLAAAIAVSGPAHAQSSSQFPKAVKPGDDKLTCEQIKAEGMEAQARSMAQSTQDLPPEVDAKIRATANAGGAAAAAMGIAALAGNLLPGGANAANAVIGQGMAISGKATQVAIQSQVRAAHARQEVDFSASLDRMSYLQALYREKCR